MGGYGEMNLTTKQIARELRAIAGHCPDETNNGIGTVYLHGTFKLRCVPTRAAVLRLANRYDKARLEKPQPERNRVTPEPTVRTFKAMIDAGEYADAVAFWSLRHTVYFAATRDKDGRYRPLANADEFQPGFVVARECGKRGGWNVTHLGSGMTVSSHATTRAGSVAAFRKIEDKIIERLAESNFASRAQEIAKAYYS